MGIERHDRSIFGRTKHVEKLDKTTPPIFLGYEGFSDREKYAQVLNDEQVDELTYTRVPADDNIHTIPIVKHNILTGEQIRLKIKRYRVWQRSSLIVHTTDQKVVPTSSSTALPIRRTRIT